VQTDIVNQGAQLITAWSVVRRKPIAKSFANRKRIIPTFSSKECTCHNMV
jgi:hypothetical protein